MKSNWSKTFLLKVEMLTSSVYRGGVSAVHSVFCTFIWNPESHCTHSFPSELHFLQFSMAQVGGTASISSTDLLPRRLLRLASVSSMTNRAQTNNNTTVNFILQCKLRSD